MGDAANTSARPGAVRVCIDVRPLFSSHRKRGIGTYIAALIAQVEQSDPLLAGVRPCYLLPPDAPTDALAALGEQAPLTGSRLTATDTPSREGAAEPPGRLLPPRRVVSSLEDADCDVYHATTLEGISLSARFKTVVTLHDLIPLHTLDWTDRAARARHAPAYVAYLRQLRLVARAHHVIAVSEATKRDAMRLLSIPAERISVVAEALEPTRAYEPGPEQVAAAHQRLGLRQPYFLAVASSSRHKNLARVVEAFARFRTEEGSAERHHLYLVGTWMGREERRLRALIAQLGLAQVARHLPWVPADEMAAVYRGATALVFPSLVEGFGLPVLEAMTCGTAVITSNRSSLPEVGGDAAIYINPERVDEIAAAMQAIATRPQLRAELVARGRERSRQFSLERAARELIAVYHHAGAKGPLSGRAPEVGDQ